MVKIQPLGDKVAVRVIVEDLSNKGILTRPVLKEDSNVGIVAGVGEGTTLSDGTVQPLKVSIGDKVIFNLNLGIKFTDENGDLYRILSVRDVVCKLIEEEK